MNTDDSNSDNQKHQEGIRVRQDLLEGIARGERAIAEGRVMSNEDAMKRLSKWLKPTP